MYFGVAHLLGYPAPYDDPIYRFADFNAGRFASRNAAFQKAVSELRVLRSSSTETCCATSRGAARERSNTEAATLRLADRLGMRAAEIRRDLELGLTAQFEGMPALRRVFAARGPVQRQEGASCGAPDDRGADAEDDAQAHQRRVCKARRRPVPAAWLAPERWKSSRSGSILTQ